jgi:hypothetical protein
MTGTGLSRAQLALVSLLLCAACTADTSPPTAARPKPGVPISLQEGANPVVHTVTGHWEVIGGGGNLNKVSVSAIQRLDGTTTGQVQYEQFGPDGQKTILAHGEVLCVAVEGNVARIGASGQDALSNTPDATIYAIMTVIDNGEGANDPPDRGSSVLVVSSAQRAQLHCDAPPPISHPLGLIIDSRVFWSERGNIQVQ